MATKQKPERVESVETGGPDRQQVSFAVEPGTKIQITVEVGEEIVEGKVPLTVSIEQVPQPAVKGEHQFIETPQPASKPLHVPVVTVSKLRPAFEGLKSRLKTYDLAMWLFILAVAIYLVTRLIGLKQFPIYFFTDEAIQSQSMIDLIKNGYKDAAGAWFPTYFRNGEYYNLSLSVYLQWLPSLLFGRSAVATRATSVFITLIAAVSVGLILRDVFKMKYWWTGTLFLSITPAWFLHSRTAFETAEFVAFYAGTLCAYLLYRHKSPRYLYLAILLGALSFYTYSPAQFIVPLTALGLFISDWRYHWEKRRTLLIGLALIVILALPYIRYSLNNPSVPFAHLHTLYSYWFDKIPVSEKFTRYFSEFGIGLSPWYWYLPNDRDLSRHLMKGYGNIMLVTLPFALLGMAYVLRNLRSPACRTILIALLISPAAAALVQTSITRALVFVVPAAILTEIGFEQVLQWIVDPMQRLAELREGRGFTPMRIAAALLILLIGIPIAFISRESVNRIVLSALALILALQVSGFFEWFAQSRAQLEPSTKPKLWKLSQTIVALLAFLTLSGANVYMLNDALRNGPLWFRDYGLGGMQYGAFQIFDILQGYIAKHPNARIIFSPDWANGADVVARFFLGDSSPIQIGSVRGHITEKLLLDDNTLFVMTPQEYDTVIHSDKLTDIQVETIIPYPDGNPGFYFVHLRYVDNIDEIFAAEKAARQVLRETVVNIDGQDVKLRYSYLDSDFQAESMALVFDNDPFTVAKTFESNPFVIEMTFPTPRTINGFSIIIGSAKVRITLKCYSVPGAQPTVYTFEGQGTKQQPQLSFDLPAPTQARILRVETQDVLSAENSKVHIWELKLR
ncbi:MAG TPA: glycosyltransferase family 39 protein [Anaerolineales bacterium]|nr:glycosyltransferase family 39 protein [Anaerolineales bacterium]